MYQLKTRQVQCRLLHNQSLDLELCLMTHFDWSVLEVGSLSFQAYLQLITLLMHAIKY